jgi:isopenicillin-N epimerase
VDFIARRLPELLAEARAALAAYVGAAPGDLTFVQNAGTGVNIAARSLELRPGDEILATGLEYGGCNLAWEWLCGRTGARYVRAAMPLPVADVVDHLFALRSERTRVVFVSHVTSETALRLPVEEIVARARAEGLVTIVDGAHAPGHLPLDLDALGADFYAGNCHKWRLRFLRESPDVS